MAIFFNTTPVFAENSSPKVVVVGAGLAGLTTAHRLQQKGVDVHVYEARGRVGGRVFTVKVDGKIAELGAKSIEENAQNLLGLIEEFGLELVKGNMKLNHSYFNAVKLVSIWPLLYNRHFDREMLKVQLDSLAQRSKNMQEVLNGILEQEDPIYKAFTVFLAAFEGGTVDKLSSCYAQTLYHMLLGGMAASYPALGEEETILDWLALKGGNALLPEAVAKTLENRLHLNHPLLRVSKNADGAFVLTFPNEQNVKADILVLAIPCSVYGDIIFEENVLPPVRLEAIKNVHYGTNAKIMVPFSKLPQKEIIPINDRAMGSFDSQRSILTLYYTGDASRFTADTIFDAYRNERPMIEMGFAEICPLLTTPVLAKDESFASYEGPVGYSWPNDPYAKGSYSYIAAGQEAVMTATHEEQGERVKTLFAPIDQKLHFAGEHASILTDVAGTMEAACESGERTARMVLNAIGVNAQ